MHGEVVRRAALPRPLHPHRLQREPLGDPGAPAQGAARASSARAFRHGGHDYKALVDILETLSARRAVPDLGGRALRDRARASSTSASAAACGCSSAGTRSAASSRASSTSRATASTRENRAADPGDPPGGVRRHERRLRDARLRVGARAAPRRHLTSSRARSPSYDVARDRGAARRRDARVDGRPPRRALEQLGEERAGALFARYAEAFPVAYREDFPARQAVLDIERIERLDPAGDLGLSLYLPLASPHDHLAFKLAALGPAAPALGRAAAAREHGRQGHRRAAVRDPAAATAPPVWIYDFGLRHDEGAEFQADDVREMFQDAFARAWRGESENDGFNRLVLSARADRARDHVLRAIAKYLRQAGSTFSQTYMEEALAAHPERRAPARRALPAPARPGAARGHRRQGAGARARARAARSTRSRASTRTGSCAASCAWSGPMLRTNYFQTDAGRPARSRTSRSSSTRTLVPDLPEPRPMFEVFVYSPRVEAVHLRGGQGRARRHPLVGPPRGLPHRGARADEGADGQERGDRPGRGQGRLRRQAAPAGGDRDALREEVVECYRTFMRGLLDVTDTIAGGKVVPPPDVVRHDEDDPYLVVAADKGTATFSDIANAIATEYGFWLGDAFASGRLGRLRPQGDGRSRPAAPGSRSSATSASSGPTSRPPTSPSSASATCPATSSATACCSRGTSG